MDKTYLSALHDRLGDLVYEKSARELVLIADERVPGEEELFGVLAEDIELIQLDKKINEVKTMIERSRKEEIARIHMAESLIEGWMVNQRQEYTDLMITPEVEAVLDIGDAINRGELELSPTVQAVVRGQPLGEPFLLTRERLEKYARLEAALTELRNRRGRLASSN